MLFQYYKLSQGNRNWTVVQGNWTSLFALTSSLTEFKYSLNVNHRLQKFRTWLTKKSRSKSSRRTTKIKNVNRWKTKITYTYTIARKCLGFYLTLNSLKSPIWTCSTFVKNLANISHFCRMCHFHQNRHS